VSPLPLLRPTVFVLAIALSQAHPLVAQDSARVLDSVWWDSVRASPDSLGAVLQAECEQPFLTPPRLPHQAMVAHTPSTQARLGLRAGIVAVLDFRVIDPGQGLTLLPHAQTCTPSAPLELRVFLRPIGQSHVLPHSLALDSVWITKGRHRSAGPVHRTVADPEDSDTLLVRSLYGGPLWLRGRVTVFVRLRLNGVEEWLRSEEVRIGEYH
jgi:hypothetical protein